MCTYSNTNPHSTIIYRKALQHTDAEILYKILQLELWLRLSYNVKAVRL